MTGANFIKSPLKLKACLYIINTIIQLLQISTTFIIWGMNAQEKPEI